MHAHHGIHAIPGETPAALLPSLRTLRLSPCDCGPRDLVRLRRPEWLRRLVPSRRLYRCPHCGATVFYGR
jgi:hypothetical protein